MKSFIRLLFLAMAVASRAQSQFIPMELTGQTFTHDPSSIVKEHSKFYMFGTGPGIRTKSSPDLRLWENGQPVFGNVPKWVNDYVHDYDGVVWAPDVVRVRGIFFLYYSCSKFGKPTSVIGLATSSTLDFSATNYFWQDAGAVISSTNGSPFNTIDPSAFLDRDGKLWLAFGSYWKGIFLMELNPQTGKRTNTNAPQHLAWNESIEAACLTRHENFYYLFVNWGQCCKGTNSTYEVRVGRAEKITGPYRDRDGNDLATGGGSPFLETFGRFIGPGHIGIMDDGGTNGLTQFSYHYYDDASRGRSRLAIGKIDWSNGWPVAVR